MTTLHEVLTEALNTNNLPSGIAKRTFVYRGRFEGLDAEVSFYDAETNVGYVTLSTTGFRMAFTIVKESKPRALRDFTPEYQIQLHQIDTVVRDGAVVAALGKKRPGVWFIRKDTLSFPPKI